MNLSVKKYKCWKKRIKDCNSNMLWHLKRIQRRLHRILRKNIQRGKRETHRRMKVSVWQIFKIILKYALKCSKCQSSVIFVIAVSVEFWSLNPNRTNRIWENIIGWKSFLKNTRPRKENETECSLEWKIDSQEGHFYFSWYWEICVPICRLRAKKSRKER